MDCHRLTSNRVGQTATSGLETLSFHTLQSYHNTAVHLHTRHIQPRYIAHYSHQAYELHHTISSKRRVVPRHFWRKYPLQIEIVILTPHRSEKLCSFPWKVQLWWECQCPSHTQQSNSEAQCLRYFLVGQESEREFKVSSRTLQSTLHDPLQNCSNKTRPTSTQLPPLKQFCHLGCEGISDFFVVVFLGAVLDSSVHISLYSITHLVCQLTDDLAEPLPSYRSMEQFHPAHTQATVQE